MKTSQGFNESIFAKARNIPNYLEKISLKSQGTRDNASLYLRKFENYLQETYSKSNEDVLQEILSMPTEQRERELFDILQDFVNFLDGKKITAKFIKGVMYVVKSYLRFWGFKITSEDIKDGIVLPKIIKEEREPLLRERLQSIINNSTGINRILYLVCSSTGMRPVEVLQIRKKDLVIDEYPRILIKIPAKFTKTKRYRETIMTEETGKEILPLLEKMEDDDVIFNPKKLPYKSIRINAIQSFNRLREKLGFNERYDSGVHKITFVSFRSWFVTKCNRIDYGFGHALAGHDQYMKSYDRLTRDDKMKFFIEAEKLLQVFDYVDEDQEKRIERDGKRISNLEDQLESIKELLRMKGV